MKTILKKINSHFDKKLPFVIYKKPNELNIIGVLQKTDELFFIDDFTEKGFAFCNFDGTKNVIIPENQSEILIEQMLFDEVIVSSNNNENNDNLAKENFEKLVSNGIKAINKNQFQKVVLSRKETLQLFDFDIINSFKKCISNYPSAFCYCFYHPEIGLWMGATPEQFLQISNNNLSTVALAGTQKVEIDPEDSGDPIWEEKEIQEQQFVADFITENLQKNGLNPEISAPFTVRAGNLFHIKTIINCKFNQNFNGNQNDKFNSNQNDKFNSNQNDKFNINQNDKFNSNQNGKFNGNQNDKFNLKNIIRDLHPTPAVCGLPKENAKDFILKNENYNREFYTGFLGELNCNNKTDLFVNLRCMQISPNVEMTNWNANLYIGCGLTKDSIPENEWLETVNKSMVMKQII